MLASFNGVLPVLVEDHVDLHTVVGKERGTDDVVVLFGNSSKVLAPADLDICMTAMPSMITTVGFGDAVSR